MVEHNDVKLALGVEGGDNTVRHSVFRSNEYALQSSSLTAALDGFNVSNCLFLNNFVAMAPFGPAEAANNVFYGNGFAISLAGVGPEVVVRNNVMLWSGSAFTGVASGHDIDYNVVWDETLPESMRWPESDHGAHAMFVDPELVDPNAGDFHLRVGSPLVDAGDPDSAYDDADGSRNDIGAFGGPYGNWTPP